MTDAAPLTMAPPPCGARTAARPNRVAQTLGGALTALVGAVLVVAYQAAVTTLKLGRAQ